MAGCNHQVFDRDNADSNAAIYAQYGSELAGGFGMKDCGEPVVWGGKCEMHKIERRQGKDRRKKAVTP